MRKDEWSDLDVQVVVAMACVILAILAAGIAFISYDTPCEAHGAGAGANAATVEQIMEGS